MALRVLHIFAPQYQERFSGASVRWKSCFGRWKDPSIIHYVLDTDSDSLVEAKNAFDFTYYDNQKGISRWKRFIWIFQLKKNLNNYCGQYDILHFHVLWWGGLLMILWSKFKKIPTIYESVLQGSDTPPAILCESLGNVKLWFLKKVGAIITISNAIAEDYLNYGFSKNQVFTLINNVDSNLFCPVSSLKAKQNLRKKFALPEDASILLFSGSIRHRKGVDLLINAFSEVRQRYAEMFLLLVGPKDLVENPSLDESYVMGLKRLIDERQLAGRVKFTGLVKSRETMAELYRAADLFVFPSRNEGLPNVVLEAMASGLPVIVSDLPGLMPVVRHGENGWVVQIEDSDALSTVITHILENPAVATKLGHCARAHVENHHSFSAWQDDLVEIYQNLIKQMTKS